MSATIAMDLVVADGIVDVKAERTVRRLSWRRRKPFEH
jgi:hypothetical protein